MFGGDVCINQGMITGFGSPSCFTVIAYYNDVLTVQARIDLFRVYIFILMIFLSLMLPLLDVKPLTLAFIPYPKVGNP